MIRKVAMLASLGVVVGLGSAQAQEPGLTPSYGTLKLNSGFEPDPRIVEILAGGSEDASSVGDNCWGFVANEPDLRVFYSADDLPLTFDVISDSDTTLVINDPDGNWICDDDSGEGLDPSITINEPVSGDYQIWVGIYSEGELVEAALQITELAPAIQMVDWRLDPNFGTIVYNAELETEPYLLDMAAGGDVDVNRTLDECRGYATAAPDLRVNYIAGIDPMVISVRSDGDTTLIVSDPEGTWICDDDSGPGNNAELILDEPLSGQYDIWVGTYSDGPLIDASLTIGAFGDSGDGVLNWDLAPNFGDVSLTAGFEPDPYVVEMVAGGDVDAESVGSNCWGFVTEAPDFRIFYQAGDWPLIISADSDADTTLIIADPDGNWVCNDDTNGLNPQLTFDLPLEGQYDIWVGTFSQGEASPATLLISEIGETETSQSDGPIDWALDPVFGEVELESGFLPDPYRVDVTAGGDASASSVDDSCYGGVTAEPTFRLYYEAGAFPLYIWVDADDDTTLLISDPDGNWICDDDGGTIAFQPALGFDNPDSGQYDIWVGRFGGGTAAATLIISETEDGREEVGTRPIDDAGELPPAQPAQPAQPAPDEPVFLDDFGGLDETLPGSASLSLSAGFSPDPTTVAVEAGGTIGANMVGDSCAGNVTAAATVQLDYGAEAWPLIISVDSDLDTTLVVLTPGGNWLCDDDSGEGLNPSLTIDAPAAGDYSIWVGRFGNDIAPATVYLSEVSSR